MLKNLWAWIGMKVEGVFSDDRGVTLLEYAAIAFLVLVVCIVLITTVGTNVNQVWSYIASALPGN